MSRYVPGIERFHALRWNFFLEEFVLAVPGGLFREASRELFQPMILGFVFGSKFREPISTGVTHRRNGYWVSVRGFRALKYDVRHTPIVIERTAIEWKLKRT